MKCSPYLTIPIREVEVVRAKRRMDGVSGAGELQQRLRSEYLRILVRTSVPVEPVGVVESDTR